MALSAKLLPGWGEVDVRFGGHLRDPPTSDISCKRNSSYDTTENFACLERARDVAGVKKEQKFFAVFFSKKTFFIH